MLTSHHLIFHQNLVDPTDQVRETFVEETQSWCPTDLGFLNKKKSSPQIKFKNNRERGAKEGSFVQISTMQICFHPVMMIIYLERKQLIVEALLWGETELIRSICKILASHHQK